MNNRQHYCQICEEEGSNIPLFQQYWWMENVCDGKHWDVALAYDTHGRLSAALPYLVGSKCGLHYIVQPQLTQFNGPWYNYPDDLLDETHRLHFEQAAAEQLISHLDSLRLFYYQQNWAPGLNNWQPFYWAGYRQTTRYTYRLDDIGDTQRLFEHFSVNERQRRILKLQQETHLVALTPEAFADFQQRCRNDRRQNNLVPRNLLLRLCHQALQRHQGLVSGLATADGNVIAALFTPYDTQCAYYLVPAVDRQWLTAGASETLLWLVLQQLSSRTKAFDFEGSMDKGIAQFYRSFGARQTPYFAISKCPIPIML